MSTPPLASESNAYIEGISTPPRRPGAHLFKAVVLGALFVAAFWAVERYRTQEADQLAVAQIDDLSRQIRDEEKRIVEALGRGLIVTGMTREQVLAARGRPYIVQRGETMIPELRRFGAVEHWIYEIGSGNTVSASFGLNGLVIRSSDRLDAR